MGKRREEKATPTEVASEVKQVAVVGNHHLLDAARKAASALESVSNEYGVKLLGMIYVVPFENSEVHRSAHSHVRNNSGTDPQYDVSVDYNATA